MPGAYHLVQTDRNPEPQMIPVALPIATAHPGNQWTRVMRATMSARALRQASRAYARAGNHAEARYLRRRAFEHESVLRLYADSCLYL